MGNPIVLRQRCLPTAAAMDGTVPSPFHCLFGSKTPGDFHIPILLKESAFSKGRSTQRRLPPPRLQYLTLSTARGCSSAGYRGVSTKVPYIHQAPALVITAFTPVNRRLHRYLYVKYAVDRVLAFGRAYPAALHRQYIWLCRWLWPGRPPGIFPNDIIIGHDYTPLFFKLKYIIKNQPGKRWLWGIIFMYHRQRQIFPEMASFISANWGWGFCSQEAFGDQNHARSTETNGTGMGTFIIKRFLDRMAWCTFPGPNLQL